MKLKKSTVLSIVTAGTIMVATAGTFATWDEMTKTSEAGTVTIDSAVTMTVATPNFSAVAGRTELGDAPKQATTVEVNVKDVPETAKENYELKLTPEVTNSDGSDASGSVGVTATIAEADKALTGGAEDKKNVTLEVTPDDTIASTGGTYNVKLTAELVKKSTTPASN